MNAARKSRYALLLCDRQRASNGRRVSIRRDGDGDGDVTPTSSPLGCDLGPSWRTRAPAQIRVAVPSRPHALQGQGPQPKVTADTHMVISSIASPSERAPLLTSLSVDRSCLGLATIEHGAADRSDSKQQRRARTYRRPACHAAHYPLPGIFRPSWWAQIKLCDRNALFCFALHRMEIERTHLSPEKI